MIDLFLNNAGIGHAAAFVDLSSTDVHDTLRINKDALVRLTHAALPPMIDADRGSLIDISSAASRGPVAHHTLYVATKAFVTNFGQALSLEQTNTHVTSTTVLVGYIPEKYDERNGLAPEIAESKCAGSVQVVRQPFDAARDQDDSIDAGPSRRWRCRRDIRFPGLASFVGRLLIRPRRLVAVIRNQVRS